MVKSIVVIKPKKVNRKVKLVAPKYKPNLKVKPATTSEKIASALVKELKKSRLIRPPAP